MPFRLPTRLLRPLVVRQKPLPAVQFIIRTFLARNACPTLLLLKGHTLDAWSTNCREAEHKQAPCPHQP